MDLLGEPGLSIQTSPIENHKQQADWVGEVLTKLNLTKVHLLGISFGGWLVVNYAVYYPEYIASIILLDFCSILFKNHSLFTDDYASLCSGKVA